MANSYGYVTFFRGRARFLPILIGSVLAGGFAFGILEDPARALVLIAICLAFFGAFLYEAYLSSLPIVEIISDSMTIRQMYDPIIKWRFIFTTHIIGFASVMLAEVKLDKKDKPEILVIQYAHGTQIKKCYLTRNDIFEFENVIKLIKDRLPNLAVNYQKPT